MNKFRKSPSKSPLKTSKSFAVGKKVQWKWLGRAIVGKVVEVHVKSISKTIKGKIIKRNGSDDNPAYMVESDAGNLALKLHSELQVAEAGKGVRAKPKMFADVGDSRTIKIHLATGTFKHIKR